MPSMTTNATFYSMPLSDSMLSPGDTLDSYTDHHPSYRQTQTNWKPVRHMALASGAAGLAVTALVVSGLFIAGFGWALLAMALAVSCFIGSLATTITTGMNLSEQRDLRRRNKERRLQMADKEHQRSQRPHAGIFPQDDAHTQFAASVTKTAGDGIQVLVNMYTPLSKKATVLENDEYLAGDPATMLYRYHPGIMHTSIFDDDQVAEVAEAFSDAQQTAEELEQRAYKLYCANRDRLLDEQQQLQQRRQNVAGTIAAVQQTQAAPKLNRKVTTG